jgi:hypothetical protein
MNPQSTKKTRKEIEAKMAQVFGEKISSLPSEYQEILLEDMVTAFENRYTVLNRAQENTEFIVDVQRAVEYETI